VIRVLRLYAGDDGQSHVSDEHVELEAAGPNRQSPWQPASGVRFEETPAGSALAWHDAPRAQYVLTLSGRLEFTTRDGERFEIGPGDVLLADDTTGGGHSWRILGPEPWRRAYVALAQP
jgi:quercetin dioxygenase-like cupin family protein